MNQREKIKALASPCPSCPWRLDQDAHDIPGFSLEKAENLAATCPDENNVGPSYGAPWFACHQSVEGREIPCAGWLASVGHAHPNVRLAIMEGRLDAQSLDAHRNGPELHQTYSEVLAKLRTSRKEG
ncbi:DUF6283 family protein [Caballeronia sp. LZ001]|uniref:DUF6283 family protein n=1 Tax=Caballeronia sp. LZ001 TaxID=3038553 RepID=UPI0028549EA2|nr:DUF6283 family protein [Caballeronia sp. LZ001]MDR5804917.1 DUF6283 family protein [Caballeronia sp. LZ001]